MVLLVRLKEIFSSRREFDLQSPTAPTSKEMRKKRPASEALESTPPITPQLSPPASTKEPVPPPKMVIVDIPMVKQETLVPSQVVASNSRSHRNYLPQGTSTSERLS